MIVLIPSLVSWPGAVRQSCDTASDVCKSQVLVGVGNVIHVQYNLWSFGRLPGQSATAMCTNLLIGKFALDGNEPPNFLSFPDLLDLKASSLHYLLESQRSPLLPS